MENLHTCVRHAFSLSDPQAKRCVPCNASSRTSVPQHRRTRHFADCPSEENMNESNRLATKAQAQAVREFLGTLGMEITHTQALEVIARGEGRRSRHAPQLACATAATSAPLEAPNRGITQAATEVVYGYTDAYNCKRRARAVFAGKLRTEQLELILNRLDEGEYFIPAQVGLSCLTQAFNDLLEVQTVWHSLRLWPKHSWQTDEEGYVLNAGAVRSIEIGQEEAFSVTCDADNLFLRFARVRYWEEARHLELANQPWRPSDHHLNPDFGLEVVRKTFPQLSGFSDEHLEPLARLLLQQKFHAQRDELTLRVGMSAYLHAKFVVQDGQLLLDLDASTYAGEYLTETGLIPLSDGPQGANLQAALDRIDAIRKAVQFDPRAWLTTN